MIAAKSIKPSSQHAFKIAAAIEHAKNDDIFPIKGVDNDIFADPADLVSSRRATVPYGVGWQEDKTVGDGNNGVLGNDDAAGIFGDTPPDIVQIRYRIICKALNH